MAPSEAAPVLGVLAAAASVANTIPYVRDIVRGTTRPHRGTWLIWAVLAIVVCESQRADGASWSVIMAGALAAAVVGTVELSLLLYPLYFDAAIAILIHRRRSAVAAA
jgi:hypothetical protein